MLSLHVQMSFVDTKTEPDVNAIRRAALDALVRAYMKFR